MKINLNNVTNMIAYSNIPEGDNKIVLKYGELSAWNSKGDKYYSIFSRFLNEEQSEIEVNIEIMPLIIEGSFVTGLNIINGIKLDTDWTNDIGSYKATSKNNFLINRFNKHEDLYIYGFPKLN